MSVLKNYNPEADSNGTLQLHSSKSGCCNDKGEFCKYSADLTDLEEVTAITITKDGEPYVINITPESATPKGIRKAVALALKENGYDPYYDDSWKGVTVVDGVLCIIGEAIPVSVTKGGEEVSFDKKCETGRICKFRGLAEFDTELGNIGETAVGTADGFPAGDAAAVQTALETALDAEGVAYSKVEVEENNSYGAYVYTIHLVGDATVTVGGAALAHCGCYHEFVA